MAAMRAAVAAPRGLRRLFSTTTTSTFMPPPPTASGAPGREKAKPSPILSKPKDMAPMRAAVAAPHGLRRLFSTTTTSTFMPPPPTSPGAPGREKAEPSPNLFVSGLSKRTTTEKLHEAFSQFGEVVNARVVTDRVSGYSKGFGFVRYATIEEAAKGIEGMDGKFLDGWVIFAEYAKPRPPPGQPMPPPYGQH